MGLPKAAVRAFWTSACPGGSSIAAEEEVEHWGLWSEGPRWLLAGHGCIQGRVPGAPWGLRCEMPKAKLDVKKSKDVAGSPVGMEWGVLLGQEVGISGARPRWSGRTVPRHCPAATC